MAHRFMAMNMKNAGVPASNGAMDFHQKMGAAGIAPQGRPQPSLHRAAVKRRAAAPAQVAMVPDQAPQAPQLIEAPGSGFVPDEALAEAPVAPQMIEGDLSGGPVEEDSPALAALKAKKRGPQR